MLLSALRVLVGLGLLVALLRAGGFVADAARMPVPGSVVGMLLLTLGLQLRIVPERLVRPAAELLLRNMALLFVPPGVGIMLHFGLLRREWLPVAVGSVASVVAVLWTVAFLQQRAERRE